MTHDLDPARRERLDGLTSWHADWAGLRVVVLGLGVTGFAVADTLTELGAEVLVVAPAVDDDRAELLSLLGARLLLAPSDAAPPAELDAVDADLVVISPGFAPHHPWSTWAAGSGAAVWGDVELAWRVRDKVPGRTADWLLVTGTNGKTTTTQLTAAMVLADGRRVAPCGNIGVPVLDAVRDPEGFDVLVVELSSHQLHQLPTSGPGALRPVASTCLNLEADHLEWHGSFEAYRDAKAKVYENTVVAAVWSKEDDATRRMVEDADVVEGCRAVGFGLGAPGPSELGLVASDDSAVLVDRAFLDDRRHRALELTTLAAAEEVGLGADHLLLDVLAAAALARAVGVEPAAIRDAVAAFRVDRHRTEVVARAAGVTWVDDSKATNPHAAQASLAAFPSVVWLVGGLLKGVDPDPLVEGAVRSGRLRAAVLLGVDRSELRAAFARHAPELPVLEVDETQTGRVMPTAVRLAAGLAHGGDAVLLAPAAASMDQFTDYAARGRSFAEAVHEHLGGDADGETVDRTPATPVD